MFGRGAFERNHFVEKPVELRELLLAQLAFHPRVVRFNGARKPFDELRALGGGRHDGAALVFRIALAADEPIAFHPCQHAREARAEDERFARDASCFYRAVFAEHTQHAPLLVRQAVAAQAGARVRHHGFARLQQQAREVAVAEGGHGPFI